jgi:hypothetical protein
MTRQRVGILSCEVVAFNCLQIEHCSETINIISYMMCCLLDLFYAFTLRKLLTKTACYKNKGLPRIIDVQYCVGTRYSLSSVYYCHISLLNLAQRFDFRGGCIFILIKFSLISKNASYKKSWLGSWHDWHVEIPRSQKCSRLQSRIIRPHVMTINSTLISNALVELTCVRYPKFLSILYRLCSFMLINKKTVTFVRTC